MFSGTDPRRPPLRGLIPGIAAASLVAFAGGAYSLARLISGGGVSAAAGLFDGGALIDSLGFSLAVAAASTAISLVIGVALALWLWGQASGFPGFLYVLPLILPHVVAAFLTIAFFSRSGLLSSIAFRTGVIGALDDFPVLVFDNGGIGIVIAYVYKETSFVTLMTLAALRKIDPRMIQTSEMLGASRLRSLRTVVLPAAGPAAAVAGIIVFLYSFGAFDIPFLVGSSSRPMAAVSAYRLFFEGSLADRPRALALLTLIWALSLAMLGVFHVLRRLAARGISGGPGA
jgi:putative spermidine/putrescine transport system permease protein